MRTKPLLKKSDLSVKLMEIQAKQTLLFLILKEESYSIKYISAQTGGW